MLSPFPLYQNLLSSKITLFYLENLENYDNKKDLALLSQGKSKFLESGKENLLPPQQSEFVSENVGSGGQTRTGNLVLNRHPRYHCATPECIISQHLLL